MNEYAYKIQRPYSKLVDNKTWNDDIQTSCLVVTKHCLCDARSYSWLSSSGKRTGRTVIRIVKDGREHSEPFNKYYSSRYMVTLSERFANKLFNPL